MNAITDTIEAYRGMYSDVPKDNVKAINWIVSRVKYNTAVSDKKKLSRHIVRVANGVTYEDTLDTYYVNMINDTLEVIRKGGTAYIFNIDQVKDVVKFEPTAQFTYIEEDKCFEVTL